MLGPNVGLGRGQRDSGVPKSLPPQTPFPPRLETRAQGGERALTAPRPGGPQGGVQEGVTSLGSL